MGILQIFGNVSWKMNKHWNKAKYFAWIVTELFDILLVSFIQPAFIKYPVLVNIEIESLPQSRSRKDLLAQL